MIRNKTAIEYKLDTINIINNNLIAIEKAKEHTLNTQGTTLNTMIMGGEIRILNNIKDQLLDLATIKGGE